MRFSFFPAVAAAFLISTGHVNAELKAGAAVVDVTPSKFPVLVNGGMTSRSASEVVTRINARAIVLDDGREQIGIVVVDSCMMPRPLLDEAKQLAAQQTRLKPERILISATHTHTAPSSMGALGTDADTDYLPVLRAGIAEALMKAEANLEPATVGWAVENAAQFTALRRWIRRPDRLADDPFGNATVRANMHSGSNWDDVTGESGPEDPDLSMISLQALDGRPIAVLANFSMHYFSGQKALAADYFGLFSEGLQKQIVTPDRNHPPFVGIMSHGCSGDIWRRDYKKPPAEQNPFKTIEDYTAGLLEIAVKAYATIEHKADADLAMAEARPVLNYRVPDLQRLDWAKRIVAELGDRPPKTPEEVYALEQIILHERQTTEIVVQGLRIGDIGIATTPNETYALTGLKVKLQSPLPKTMVIELANGGDGYSPPPEQHVLGGYNTWAARSAGLEVQAEPKITETALQLLEESSARPRRHYQQSRGKAAIALAKAKPLAWWRLDEMRGTYAVDSSGNGRDGHYEPAVAYFLEGPASETLCANGERNRAAHFAGGRMLTRLSQLTDAYTVTMWFWNGMPNDARDVTGWMCSRGHNNGLSADSEHLGIGGTSTQPGHLIFARGNSASPLLGSTEIARWTWNHVTLVRDGNTVRAYLNGNPKPEIEGVVSPKVRSTSDRYFWGGRCDNDSNWEGRLDEIAVFDRVLTAAEIGSLGSPK
ncbi:MAG: hypothetical protein P8J37_07240 [Fuerstiella sp.]|nr:hypothetical protein [Fuerstiella sp.]